ncbi:MAG: hypothetical protein M1570_17860 [Chloroflexi bacterium]|nr:hypothetical protein [Chloroflexota bacterium]
MQTPRRSESRQVPFGAYWKMQGTCWRVSWIERTGELYAAELGPSDRFLLLGQFSTRREISNLMHHWFEGDNLGVLIQRLKD